MNIFIIVLMFLFMAGYYFMDSPSQRVQVTEIENAITRTDLRSVAECAASAHTAFIRKYSFDDICAEHYNITSEFICLNEKQATTKCEAVRNKKPAFSFIITHTAPIADGDYNNMMEILETYYQNAGVFGVFMNGVVLGGGGDAKRVVPQNIIKTAQLVDGQLVYLTQYEIPDVETTFVAPVVADINCPAGTVKTYRFSKWQCTPHNEKTSCSGDKIWDTDAGECVPDNTRRPLCASRQTAVMIDDLWECVDPFMDKSCPGGMIARLDYNTLEWECVEDPGNSKNITKCATQKSGAVYGTRLGSTLRVPSGSCTDCEQMITDLETCATSCVPNPAKINSPACYPGRTSECAGPSRAFYFGFPNAGYASNVSAVAGHTVPFGNMYSQNRKFNCLDCGTGRIDTSRSFPPYTAFCEDKH